MSITKFLISPSLVLKVGTISCIGTMPSIMVWGAGASGYVDGIRYKNHGPIRHYMQAVEEGNARVQEEHLTQTEMMEEEMFLGLRKKTGVSKKRFEEKFGVNFDQQYGSVVEKLIQQGLLVPDKDIVRMTKKGLF